jgi:alpha-D-ribose 1-methylphosphonate 5-triphosphate synthase subunit PhnG
MTLEQGQQPLNTVQTGKLRGEGDASAHSFLLGCGLRRSELAALEHDQIQKVENAGSQFKLINSLKSGHKPQP